MPSWTQNFKGLLNLFLQSNCPLCQRPTAEEFCTNCTRQLQQCKKINSFSQWKQPLPVFAWGAYGGILKRAIAAMKYDNQPQIGHPLGYWLGEAWLNSEHSAVELIVVPIPLHAEKEKKRGYNQAALIATSFCEVTGLECKSQGLQRVRATEAQFGLSATDRAKNLADAFQIGADFRSRPSVPVLLIDDIFTTGATARSAVHTLRQSGIAVYGLVAVATANQDQ